MGIQKRLRISRNQDFQLVYKEGKSRIARDFVLYYVNNDTNLSRIGITVSRKVGNAVRRNRIKRAIREIFRKESPYIRGGFDIVLIARKPANKKSFHEIEKTFTDLLKRAGLYIKNENNCDNVN